MRLPTKCTVRYGVCVRYTVHVGVLVYGACGRVGPIPFTACAT